MAHDIVIRGGGSLRVVQGDLGVGDPTAVSGYANEVLADTPVAYWRCGESAGPTLADSSGNGFTATEQGAAMQYNQTDLIVAPDADGAVAGNGVLLDNWTFGTPALLQPTVAVSVECWFRPSTINDALVNMMAATPADCSGYKLLYGFGGNHFRWYIGTTGGGSNANSAGAGYIQSPTSYPPGSTYHVVGTFTAGSRILYVNGTPVASDTKGGTLKYGIPSGGFFNAATGIIGNEIFSDMLQTPTALDGIIDEIAIYDSVLSPARITAHYNEGL